MLLGKQKKKVNALPSENHLENSTAQNFIIHYEKMSTNILSNNMDL